MLNASRFRLNAVLESYFLALFATACALLPPAFVSAAEQEVSEAYFSSSTLRLRDGREVEAFAINAPPTPPRGFEVEREAVLSLPVPDVGFGINMLTVPAYNWVFGCSAVSGAMIAGYYDRSGWPNIYTGPTNGGVMPLNNSSWPMWSDGSSTYPNCPLVASHNGIDGRATRGSIDDYWVQYGSGSSDPYVTGAWTPHAWSDAIGDYMKTSQSAYGNTDGSTVFYNWTGSPGQLGCDYMQSQSLPDGTLGRKLFYQARGYTVTDCYNQKTDNTIAGGFSFAQYKTEIDAGRPVLLNLRGHSVVGVGYDDATNTVYIHDTWDYSEHTMTWGGSYSGMQLLSVSIVNLSASGILNAPASLTATAASSSQIDLQWTDNSSNESGFKIERKTGASGSWGEIATVAANATGYASTGLAASTAYYYRVRAYNATGNSGYSNEAYGVTWSAVPAVPTSLTATAASSSRIDLRWTDNSSNESGFKIERKTGASGSWGEIATVAANATGYASTGLAANTAYYYRVRAYNATGNSGYSNEANGLTWSAVPAVPTSLTATAVSSSRIDLRWTDNSSNESGFKIERKTGASGAWTEVGTAAANATTYSSTGLATRTTYYYRVRAYNATGNSGYSNEANAATSSPCTSSTTALSAGYSRSGALAATDCRSAVRPGSYYDNFTFSATAGKTYTIALNASAFDTYLYLLNSAGSVLAENDDPGLNARIVYTATTSGTVTIHATSSAIAATGAYTVTLFNGIAPSVPSAPDNLAAVAASSAQIYLSWTDNGSNESGFKIERKTGVSGVWAQIATVAANATGYASTGLAANTAYYYRVRAYNATGNSDYSNEANAATPVRCTSSTTALSAGYSRSGALAATDCRSAVRPGSYYDNFTFSATAGKTYTIALSSSAFDTYLYLLNSTGSVLAENDNPGFNARIVYTATTSGTVTIHATSYASAATGGYTVTRN